MNENQPADSGNAKRYIRIGILLVSLLVVATQCREKRELLSRHETLAVYAGLTNRICANKTPPCPENCDSSGEFAAFNISSYLTFEHPSRYGDFKQREFLLRISDFHKQPVGDEKWRITVQNLKPGDEVLLAWDQISVSFFTSSYIERPLLALQKLTVAEAKELLPRALPMPPASAAQTNSAKLQ